MHGGSGQKFKLNEDGTVSSALVPGLVMGLKNPVKQYDKNNLCLVRKGDERALLFNGLNSSYNGVTYVVE